MKDIVGYEGLYIIEENGRIWSCRANKYIKSQISYNGYYRIGLYDRNGISKKHLIHRLIAQAYIPNPENKPCVDHIDRTRTNNSINNLRWVSVMENNQNMSLYSTNELEEQNIIFDKTRKRFRVRIQRNEIIKTRYFKTKEQAIKHRDECLKSNDLS